MHSGRWTKWKCSIIHVRLYRLVCLNQIWKTISFLYWHNNGQRNSTGMGSGSCLELEKSFYHTFYIQHGKNYNLVPIALKETSPLLSTGQPLPTRKKHSNLLWSIFLQLKYSESRIKESGVVPASCRILPRKTGRDYKYFLKLVNCRSVLFSHF